METLHTITGNDYEYTEGKKTKNKSKSKKALRRDATVVKHEDFNDAITEVQAKKKANLNYYA